MSSRTSLLRLARPPARRLPPSTRHRLPSSSLSSFLPAVSISRRLASSGPSLPPTPSPLPMPPDMPREDYASPAIYTLSYLSRILRLVALGIVGLGVTSLATFEGVHMYVEASCLPPSRSGSTSSGLGGNGGEDFEWAEENVPWTGGEKGGTDPRLGWKGRHAVRGAWICWNWGAGEGAASIASARSVTSASALHPDMGAKGMIGSTSVVNTVDRGFEMADEYVDVAIKQARAKGMVFPPNLSSARPAGPPKETSKMTTPSSSASQADPTVLDLYLLKASIQERINTPDSLSRARDIYEQVLSSYLSSPASVAAAKSRKMRLGHKVGTLCLRLGDADEAMQWWAWSLDRGGLNLPTTSAAGAVSSSMSTNPTRSSWFGRKATPPAPSPPTPTETPTLSLTLPPPVLRAAIAILASTSAHLAQTGSLAPASSINTYALSLLPPSSPTRPSVPTSSTAAAGLHDLWLRHRTALFTLYSASIAHAQSSGLSGLVHSPPPALELTTSASDKAEVVVAALAPMPTAFASPTNGALATPARHLQRDALLLAAESSFTRGVLLERAASSSSSSSTSPNQLPTAIANLEAAGESYERAMILSAAESGGPAAIAALSSGVGGRGKEEEDGVGRSEEWNRYWRAFARVREKLVLAMQEGKERK